MYFGCRCGWVCFKETVFFRKHERGIRGQSHTHCALIQRHRENQCMNLLSIRHAQVGSLIAYSSIEYMESPDCGKLEDCGEGTPFSWELCVS